MIEVMIAKHKHGVTQAFTQFNTCGLLMQNILYFLSFFQFL